MAGARLCDWAESRGMAVLPHDSPGYPDWDIGNKRGCSSCSARAANNLCPENWRRSIRRASSQEVAACGLRVDSPHGACAPADRAVALRELLVFALPVSPCSVCSRDRCRAYRNRPLRHFQRRSCLLHQSQGSAAMAAERLTITYRDDGTSDARFRYQGTTCTTWGALSNSITR